MKRALTFVTLTLTAPVTSRKRRRTALGLAALALLATLAEPVGAQGILSPGQRVRVTGMNEGQLTGTALQVFADDSIEVALDSQMRAGFGGVVATNTMGGQTVTIPVASIMRLEVSAGQRSGFKRWGAIGGLVGGGVFALGFASAAEVDKAETAVAGALIGGVAVGLSAGFWGHFFGRREAWVPASLPRGDQVRMNLFVAPSPSAQAVSVGVGWRVELP